MWFTMCICESYPSLCDPMDCSPPGSSVHGVLQARVLDWIAIPLLCVSIYLINLSNVSLQFTPSTLLCTHKNVIDKWILLQLLFKEVQRERMKNSMGHRELGVSSPGDSYVPLDWRSHLLSFGSVQFSSVAQSCPALCDPMNCSTPGLPVHHQLPEFTQTHVHWAGDAIQPSHPLSSPSLALNLSQHQGFLKRVSSLHQVAKVLEFQLQHQSFLRTPRTELL